MNRPDEIRSCIVCVNVSCLEGGSEALFEALKERLDGSGIEMKTEICFGGCGFGPNIIAHPKGTWYSGVQLEDVDDIVAHIKGGPTPQRVLNPVDPQLHEMILSLLDAGL